MKILSKALLGAYLLTLLWLVLFKFSFDLPSVIFDHQTRSINLIPFIDASRGNIREMIDNFVVFIPLGLLLGANLKQTQFWHKLAAIFALSLVVEIVQFALAIGMTDITDVITNTLGGLFGLLAYDLGKKYIDTKKLDWFIFAVGIVLLLVFLVLRFFVLRVKY